MKTCEVASFMKHINTVNGRTANCLPWTVLFCLTTLKLTHIDQHLVHNILCLDKQLVSQYQSLFQGSENNIFHGFSMTFTLWKRNQCTKTKATRHNENLQIEKRRYFSPFCGFKFRSFQRTQNHCGNYSSLYQVYYWLDHTTGPTLQTLMSMTK